MLSGQHVPAQNVGQNQKFHHQWSQVTLGGKFDYSMLRIEVGPEASKTKVK